MLAHMTVTGIFVLRGVRRTVRADRQCLFVCQFRSCVRLCQIYFDFTAFICIVYRILRSAFRAHWQQL